MPFAPNSPAAELGFDALNARVRTLAGAPAQAFLDEVVGPRLLRRRGPFDRAAAREAMADPGECLVSVLRAYAFLRRGKDGSNLGDDAADAFLACREGGALPAPSAVLEEFARRRSARSRVVHGADQDAVFGLCALASETAEAAGLSLAGWIGRTALETGGVEASFRRVVQVRSLGPKLASTILRDFVYLHDAEAAIEPTEAIYVQPVDRWIRLAAGYVVPGADEGMPDWILAGKLGKAAKLAGVSRILLNMGVAGLGRGVQGAANPKAKLRAVAERLFSAAVREPRADPPG